jgi:CubicO group peptidase (beta-lactamase class C family)
VKHLIRRRTPAVVLAALCALTLTLTAAVPNGKPEDVGLSSERLQRINDVMQRYIGAKEIAGAVTVVARRGKITHFEAHGMADLESKAPMRKDGVFRIASMSKPVTGVAILMLVEEGKVRLTDPASRFIPEFTDTKVAVVKSGPEGTAPAPSGRGRGGPPPEITLVPASRPITIRDLLTHTSGLGSNGPGARETNRVAPRNPAENLAAHIPKLGGAPLDFQPGTEWRYSGLEGIDTLGRIVEIASGLTFDQFLRQRIFEPLGMKDTTFVPTEDRQPRFVSLYGRSPEGVLTKGETPSWLATKTYFSGGAGLWSTPEDYTQFAQMLVNGGQLNGKRLLGPRTVELMGSNHVGDLYAVSGAGRRGMGFGLTVEVVMDPVAANQRRSAGSFGWDGAFGTHFWVDPKEQIAAVLMIQRSVNTALNRDFENAIMQAVID